ncbi:MAG: TatD family hydrolase [Candidatus Omnitrophica bacterium]|nr:TatD family hydrolase [Candidatus Omnitrophota bacterium]
MDQEPLSIKLEEVLTRARQAGVSRFITIGTDLPSSQANLLLARRYPEIHAAVGIHPHEAGSATDEQLEEIERLAQDPAVVAIGEVGLDCYRNFSSLESQKRVFSQFISMSARLRLPLLLHCRDAYEVLLQLLKNSGRLPIEGILHCASGPASFILEAIALGLHVSFAGNLTYPKNGPLRQLVPLVPPQRLLLETDAPFLAPQPVRGRPNEPAYLTHTASEMAKLRGISVEALSELTSHNAKQLFRISN